MLHMRIRRQTLLCWDQSNVFFFLSCSTRNVHIRAKLNEQLLIGILPQWNEYIHLLNTIFFFFITLPYSNYNLDRCDFTPTHLEKRRCIFIFLVKMTISLELNAMTSRKTADVPAAASSVWLAHWIATKVLNQNQLRLAAK